MNKNMKVFFGIVGLTAVGYVAYRYWKDTQIDKHLEEQSVSYEELKSQREAELLEERLKERDERLKNIESSDEDQDSDGSWYRNEYNQLERKLTREEYLYGAEYDMFTEDLVEYRDENGEWQRRVRKRSEMKLLNSREHREVEDVIIAVDELGEQIESLRGMDMEYEKNIYDKKSQEALDYYMALLLDKYDVTERDVRQKLIVLSTYEYLPNLTNIHNQNLLDDLTRARKEFFAGATRHNEWVSIMEVLLYYCGKLSEESNFALEGIIETALEVMEFEYDDRDVVINDVIISFFEHNRRDRPNFDGTFGIFQITKEQYDVCQSLYDEYQKALGNFIALNKKDL